MSTFLALPITTVALMIYALRPYRSTGTVGPRRLAVLRGCVAVGAFAIVAVELLSRFDALSTGGVSILWITAVVGAALFAWRRRLRDPARSEASGTRAAGGSRGPAIGASGPASGGPSTRVEKVLFLGLAGLLLAELVLALAAYPNTWDSNHYHLTKVEHWVVNRDVEVYPTSQLPQVMFAPGAEYLLLHLRLLTGDDGLYNLVQWAAGVLAALAVSRIAAQLGANRLGQLLAAVVMATTPMVVLQSTSTQTDLAVSAWLVCAASFALDGMGRRPRAVDVLSLGAAAGLTAVTKFTGLAGLAPVLLFWGVRHLWTAWRGRTTASTGSAVDGGRAVDSGEAVNGVGAGAVGGRAVDGVGAVDGGGAVDGRAVDRRDRATGVAYVAIASVAIVLIALVVTGPFLVRADRAFGHPLGTPEYRLNLSMQRYDPAALTVNALRIASSTLVTPVAPINTATAGFVVELSTAFGIDPSDPTITMSWKEYPSLRWKPDEDHSPYPLQSALLLIAVAATLLARRVPALTRAYGLVTLGTLIMFAATLKWQPWGNRLVLPAIVLGAPLIGWWLSRLSTGRPSSTGQPGLSTGSRTPRVGAAAVTLIVLAALIGGYGSVLLGWPRRLVGPYSVFTTVEWDERFARQGHLRSGYRYAADQVRDSGARRIGVVVDGDGWEYPFWLLLPGREFVALESAVPTMPAVPATDVDAILCVGPMERCKPHLPPGWRYVSSDNWVAAGLPG